MSTNRHFDICHSSFAIHSPFTREIIRRHRHIHPAISRLFHVEDLGNEERQRPELLIVELSHQIALEHRAHSRQAGRIQKIMELHDEFLGRERLRKALIGDRGIAKVVEEIGREELFHRHDAGVILRLGDREEFADVLGAQRIADGDETARIEECQELIVSFGIHGRREVQALCLERLGLRGAVAIFLASIPMLVGLSKAPVFALVIGLIGLKPLLILIE